jgi:hypothetical protein
MIIADVTDFPWRRGQHITATDTSAPSSALAISAASRGPGTYGVNPPVLDRTRGCTSVRNWKNPALPDRHEAMDAAKLDVVDEVDKRTDSELI